MACDCTLGDVQPLSLPVSLTPMYLGACKGIHSCGFGGRGVGECQHLELPGKTRHDVDGIGASNTDSAHTQACTERSKNGFGKRSSKNEGGCRGKLATSSVHGVAVSSDHHTSGKSIVLEDNLLLVRGTGMKQLGGRVDVPTTKMAKRSPDG